MRYQESFGFLLVAIGLFVLIALVTFGITDMTKLDEGARPLQNLGGPLGARTAFVLFYLFGIVSFLFSFSALLVGLLIALGLMRRPKVKHIIAFVLMIPVLTGASEILYPELFNVFLPNGIGGLAGHLIAQGLATLIGKGGAMIVLALTGVLALILTGNLTTSGSKTLGSGLDVVIGELPPSKNDRQTQEKPKKTNGKKRVPRLSDAENNIVQPILDFSSNVRKHSKLNLKQFKPSIPVTSDDKDFSELSRQLEEHLETFKLQGKVSRVTKGPVVTTFEFQPAPGTKAAKVTGIGEDLARLLKKTSLRVIPALPRTDAIGFEIPNEDRSTIKFDTVVSAREFSSKDIKLPIALGVDTFGNPVVADLVDMPHLLVAGTTGSGKSVFLNVMLSGLICKNTAKELRMVILDPKMVELAAYNKLPHMACPVVNDVQKDGLLILNAVVEEMETRYQNMAIVGARNIEAFNKTIRSQKKADFDDFSGKWQTLPYVLVLVDEFADLIMSLGKEAELAITRLAQKARAAGIHLVITTQRPSADIVTGLIKSNFTTRVAFRVLSGVDSRTILDQTGAENLLGKGDLLFQSAAGTQRLHSAILEDSEVVKIVKSCK